MNTHKRLAFVIFRLKKYEDSTVDFMFSGMFSISDLYSVLIGQRAIRFYWNDYQNSYHDNRHNENIIKCLFYLNTRFIILRYNGNVWYIQNYKKVNIKLLIEQDSTI